MSTSFLVPSYFVLNLQMPLLWNKCLIWRFVCLRDSLPAHWQSGPCRPVTVSPHSPSDQDSLEACHQVVSHTIRGFFYTAVWGVDKYFHYVVLSFIFSETSHLYCSRMPLESCSVFSWLYGSCIWFKLIYAFIHPLVGNLLYCFECAGK